MDINNRDIRIYDELVGVEDYVIDINTKIYDGVYNEVYEIRNEDYDMNLDIEYYKRRAAMMKSYEEARQRSYNKRMFIKGDLESVKLASKREIIDCELEKNDMLTIINAGYKKILKYAALKCSHIYCDGAIIMSCFMLGWSKIVKIMLQRSDVFINDLRNNACIIRILKFHNNYISNKIITADLKYMEINEPIMLYLCSHGEANLIAKLMKITFIDPKHKNNIFIKIASKYGHYKVVDILISKCTPPLDKKLETLIAIYRFNGI